MTQHLLSSLAKVVYCDQTKAAKETKDFTGRKLWYILDLIGQKWKWNGWENQESKIFFTEEE